MKIKIENYTFNKTAKTITFTDYGSIQLDKILGVINTTTGNIIYTPIDSTLNGTVATNVLTLDYDTSSMNNTDKLLIYYYDATAPIHVIVDNPTDLSTVQTTLANILTKVNAIDVNTDTIETKLTDILTEIDTNGTVNNTNLLNVITELQVIDANTDGLEASLLSIITNTSNKATEAKQDVGNTLLSSIDTKTPALISGRVPVDGSAVTQPVSFPNGTDAIGSTQTVLNTDLLTATVNGWYDAASFQSGTIQIIGSTGISAGAIFFEQTNDNSNTVGIPLPATESNLLNANPQNSAITISANSNRLFRFAVNARYVRVRISTAFVGGTVRAIGFFSEFPFSSNVINVQQATASQLAVTATVASTTVTSISAGTNAIGDVGLQARGNATGAPTPVAINSPATPVGQIIKAGAGRVFSFHLSNSNASPRFLKVFNATAVTMGTTSALYEIEIPPNRIPVTVSLPLSAGATTGFAVAVTGARGLTDNTAITLNDVTGFATFA